MKAIIKKENGTVKIEEVPVPEHAAPKHLIVEMLAAGINAGDKADLAGFIPKGFFPQSQYGIAGVSGVGKVIAVGTDVPSYFKGKWVALYRSLQFSDDLVGAWSKFAQVHYLQCVILPDEDSAVRYCGSLVNIITPYAFWQQVKTEGHQAIINTAGNSATGLAMIGIGLAYQFPVVSIVRDEKGLKALKAMGAEHILVQTDKDFKEQFKYITNQLNATAVFDGVGGALMSEVMDVLPFGTTVYCYGYLGGQTPLTFHSSILGRGITLRNFANVKSDTVKDETKLEAALLAIAKIIHLPYFQTKLGEVFDMSDINDALAYNSAGGAKAVIRLSANF